MVNFVHVVNFAHVMYVNSLMLMVWTMMTKSSSVIYHILAQRRDGYLSVIEGCTILINILIFICVVEKQ